MVRFFARNIKHAKRLAKKRRYYVTTVGLHDSQKGVRKPFRAYTAARRFR